jgi:hypothetical protein
VSFPEVFNVDCSSGGGKQMYIQANNSQGVTTESLKQIQSLVLSAFMAQKPIKFWYDRINATCEGGKVAVKPS